MIYGKTSVLKILLELKVARVCLASTSTSTTLQWVLIVPVFSAQTHLAIVLFRVDFLSQFIFSIFVLASFLTQLTSCRVNTDLMSTTSVAFIREIAIGLRFQTKGRFRTFNAYSAINFRQNLSSSTTKVTALANTTGIVHRYARTYLINSALISTNLRSIHKY